MIEYDGVDGGSGGSGKLVKKVVKNSKNCPRVQKLQRSEKFTKAIGLEERYQGTDAPSIEEFELQSELWQFFRLFFLLGLGVFSILRPERLLSKQS